MAPSSHRGKSGRRSRVEKPPGVSSSEAPAAKRRRVEIDVIEGVEVFSFGNELDLEYFTNIEEPLPRKIRGCRGFDEDGYETASLKRIKSSFDLFIKKNSVNVLRKDHKIRVGVSQLAATSSATPAADELIVLSDDESTLESAPVPQVNTAKPVDSDDEPILISQPSDVITIDSDDSDDDVLMVSDPNAPVPQPVRACVCPNCGKVKRTDQNRRVAESDKDLGVEDVSVVTDEVAITNEDVAAVSAPIPNETAPLRPKHSPPKETPAQPVDVSEKVAAQPGHDLAELSSPASADVLTEVPPLLVTETSSASSSRSPLKGENAFSSPSPSTLSPSRPQHSAKPPNVTSLKVQKPSSSPKPPPPAATTLRVVSKESGKTFLLTVNGAKSKILKPSTLPSTVCTSTKHPRSFHYLRPGEKPCEKGSIEAKTLVQVQDPPNGPRTVGLVGIQQPTPIPKSVGPLTPEFGQIELKNVAPHTLRFTIPPNTIRVTLPPRFSEKHTAVGVDRTKKQAQVKKLVVAKPDTVIGSDGSSQITTVIGPPQSLVKRKEVVANAQKTDVTFDSSVLKSTCLSETDRDSAGLEASMPDNKDGSPNSEARSEPLVLEDDTKSVVKDLIDFVCRQETFQTSYPYDQERTDQFSTDVPCRQLRCRMGCVCVSLAKKNVRRVRCKNAGCIFGCICMVHGVVPTNRHTKTMPNMKIFGVSRRKQVLTVLPDCDDDGFCTQTALKSFLPVQKVAGSRSVSVSRGSNPDTGPRGSGPTNLSASKGLLSRKAPAVLITSSVHSSSVSQESTPRSLVSGANSHLRSSGFDAPSASKGLQIPLKVPVPKTRVANSHPTSDISLAKESLAPPSQVTAHRLSASVAQPRSFFGREKTPIPERALMCLTPGFGYVPLGEIHPTVTLDSPFKPGSSKSFLSVRQATEWLNAKLEAHLNTKMPPNLRWVVADGQTIEKKQQHRLSVDLLSSPNCSISTNGAIFS